MPFCSKCGVKIDESIRFCPACGNAVNAISTANVQPSSILKQQADARNESLAELNRIISYFDQKANEYNEYDRCCNSLNYLRKPTSSGVLILGVILTGLFGFVVLFMLSITSQSNGIDINDIIMTCFLGFPGLIGIMLIFAFFIQEKSRRRRLVKTTDRLADLAIELTEHYAKYGYCCIGPEYSNPNIIRNLYRLINSGRADTPKEAINVMIDDSHKTQMQLNAQLSAQASMRAARAANTAAFFSAASFILK